MDIHVYFMKEGRYAKNIVQKFRCKENSSVERGDLVACRLGLRRHASLTLYLPYLMDSFVLYYSS